MESEEQANVLLRTIRNNPLLSSWSRTPLHARMICDLVKDAGIEALLDQSIVIRSFVRGLIDREASRQADQTLLMTKERLLSRLAYQAKVERRFAFAKVVALAVLRDTKEDIGATGLDVPKFFQEVLSNHLLEIEDSESARFGHEMYHDYFAATELEAKEQEKSGDGVMLAVGHFNETLWNECLRLFAGLTGTHRDLISQGAKRNPFLAWQLLQECREDVTDLEQQVADEAYCVLSAQLTSQRQAVIAGSCIFVLAELGHGDLLQKAIGAQRGVFEPRGKLTDEQRALQQQVALPLVAGFVLVLRLGILEVINGKDGAFACAGRASIDGLRQIRATRVLLAILSSWTGNTFDSETLIPGAILDALIEIGVDDILDREEVGLNQTLAGWLKLASEAGYARAWPAYGKVIRLARRVYVAETGLEFDGDEANKWLRQSHESGDRNGSLELALLLIEEPAYAVEKEEGERLLRHLALDDQAACYELGCRLLKGEDLAKNESEGFGFLVSAAEDGYKAALQDTNPLICGLFEVTPSPVIVLPPWAKPFKARLKALFPDQPLDLQ